MEKILIYGDEFGTHSLNDSDPQFISHFIYTAIAIKEENIEKSLKLRNELSEKFLQSQKLKSSSKALSDKKNFQRRLDLVKEMCENLDCAIYCIIIDKQSLEGKGFQYKEVFYKFFQRIFLEQLTENYNSYSIIMHNIISNKYANEMREYLISRKPSTLFNQYTYKMANDEEEPLIQFADVIAGSLGRIFSLSHQHPRWEELFEALSPKIMKPEIFPNSSTQNIFSNNEKDEKLDLEIYKIVQQDGEKFLETDADISAKSIVEYLLFYQKIAPFKLVETYELISVIKKNTNIEISQEQLRRYIRDIRYKGVMVVTLLGKSGYKLASSKYDIIEYFSHYMKYVVPMLQKVEIANNIFKGKTTGEFVPLNESEVTFLRKLIDNINKPNHK